MNSRQRSAKEASAKGSPSDGGRLKNGISSRHEETRKLGELGSSKAAESDLE